MKFNTFVQQLFSQSIETKNLTKNTMVDKYPSRIIKHVFVFTMSILFLINANAQSIAPDGDFDENITGWHCGSLNPIWKSDEGSQLSGNGSLQWSEENFISNGGQLGGGHCDWIVVTEENDYKFEGSFKLPTTSEFENILIDFYWYTENEMFISVDSFIIPTNTITRDTWSRFEKLSTSPVAAKKLSAYLSFQFYPSGKNEVSAFLLWDDLKVFNLTDIIFINGFE